MEATRERATEPRPASADPAQQRQAAVVAPAAAVAMSVDERLARLQRVDRSTQQSLSCGRILSLNFD